MLQKCEKNIENGIKKYEQGRKELEDELTGTWGGMAKGYLKATVEGLGAVLASIPVIIKLKPASSDDTKATELYSKMEMLKDHLEDIKRENEELKGVEQKLNDEIRKVMSELTNINASTASEEDVVEIIGVCLTSLAGAQQNWETFVNFFVKIQLWIEQCTDKVFVL
jgi:hypothetical protein